MLDTVTIPNVPNVPNVTDTPARVSCPVCADALIDGACLNVGACSDADRAATPRDRGRASATTVAPRAWTVRGGVD